MLKKNILRKNHQFQDVINHKQQLVSKYIVLYQKRNNRGLRIGISISKKFANAVNRNKYRRKVRAALDNLNLWDKNLDVVLIIRKPFMQLTFEQMQTQIKKSFERT